MAKRIQLPIKEKKQIAKDQNYKCANNYDSDFRAVYNYDCPFWEFNNGKFDDSGFHIDHIIEFSISKDDSRENLQALCINCHRIKTKFFMSIEHPEIKEIKSKNIMTLIKKFTNDDMKIFKDSLNNNQKLFKNWCINYLNIPLDIIKIYKNI